MKKSNKILLGGFLLLLLFITVIHLTLYAKYKNNDFTIYNAEEDLAAQSLQRFPNILFVSVRNVPNATVRFGDVAQVEKGEQGDIRYVQKGDTLQISANPDQEGFQRRIVFYIPANATLSAFNSSLTFETGKETFQSTPAIYLQNSRAVFPGAAGSSRWGQLNVAAADSSTILFDDHTQIDRLNLQLSNSEILSAESTIGQLSIVTDSLSRISLPAKQLLKATIKTTAE